MINEKNISSLIIFILETQNIKKVLNLVLYIEYLGLFLNNKIDTF